MTMKEKLRQVKSAIYTVQYVNRREITHTRLAAVAGEFLQLHSYIHLEGDTWPSRPAEQVTYVTMCALVEVVPRSHRNCTEEIPALLNGTEIFVDPTS
jgi:hypothetical protein